MNGQMWNSTREDTVILEGHDQLRLRETRKEKANIQTLTKWRRKRIKRKNYMDTVSYENNCKQIY